MTGHRFAREDFAEWYRKLTAAHNARSAQTDAVYAAFDIITTRRSIPRDDLRRLSRKTAAELDVITARLVATGKIECNRRLTGGRPVILYQLPHDDVFWGSRA
jgi:hypothetical protein